ncbi:hypothetical protein NDU88_002425 [Pleurodeles waltl]|uniref:Uncharacterized protein n=1 Tax=Pleurodeles waltl TaxID=8319 RepID=A0AAV7WNJ5_PLEWA|nr:hypothetical protein NDU88_002425 [Pleurodeles waltl]
MGTLEASLPRFPVSRETLETFRDAGGQKASERIERGLHTFSLFIFFFTQMETQEVHGKKEERKKATLFLERGRPQRLVATCSSRLQLSSGVFIPSFNVAVGPSVSVSGMESGGSPSMGVRGLKNPTSICQFVSNGRQG